MARDLYDVLGVRHNATADEIRKAYKSLSLQYHPDKNNNAPEAAAAFTELSNAYATLSSDSLREAYNKDRDYTPTHPGDPFADPDYRRMFVEEVAKSCAAEGEFMDHEFLFENLFGKTRRGYGDGGPTMPGTFTTTPENTPSTSQDIPTGNASPRQQAEPASTSAEKSDTSSHPSRASGLAEEAPGTGAHASGETKIDANSSAESGSQAPTTSGPEEGPESSTDATTDARSDAQTQDSSATDLNKQPSVADDAQPAAPEKFKMPDEEADLVVSIEELYSGCVKKRRLRKKVYDSELQQYVTRSEVLGISVRPGYKLGDKIRFREASDEAYGIIPADIVYTIKAARHPRFTIVNDYDLRVTVNVPLVEALAGAVLEVASIAGDIIQIRTTEVIHPGSCKRIHGKGMPKFDPAVPRPPASNDAHATSLDACETHGDLVVVFNIVFPESLTADEKLRTRVLFQGIEERVFAEIDGSEQVSMRRTSSMFTSTIPTSMRRVRSTHGPETARPQDAPDTGRAIPRQQAAASDVSSSAASTSFRVKKMSSLGSSFLSASSEAAFTEPENGNSFDSGRASATKSKSKKWMGIFGL